jgi:indolepyruvate ferredoxin oxidoreductase, beta subunit
VQGPAEPCNVVFTGVGGQGNVIAAKVAGSALLGAGYEVAVGDVFGLSQRGGSVASHLRFWRGAPLSPLIPAGRAHYVVGFEPLEALRVLLSLGGPQTGVVVSTGDIPPTGVLMGKAEYPPVESLLESMRSFASGVVAFDGLDLARRAGNVLALNMVMVGAAAGLGLLPLALDRLVGEAESTFAPKLRAVNQSALELGHALGVDRRGTMKS